MKPGLVIKERRLIPVSTGGNSKLDKLLKNVQRSTIRDEILVCALTAPDGKEGVFLDDAGREYLIKEKELYEKLSYISAKYVKKEVMRYGRSKKTVMDYDERIRGFLEKSDTPKRYAGWNSPDGYDFEIQIEPKVNEETESLNEEFKAGKTYMSDDGHCFKVLSNRKGKVKIKDLELNKIYDVEVSDLELMKAKELNEDKENDEGFPICESKLVNYSNSMYLKEGDTVMYKGGKYRVEDPNIEEKKGVEISSVVNGKRKSIYVNYNYLELCEEVHESLNEEFDPFKDLKKVDLPMRKGLYTDGWGNVYEAPKHGLSRTVSCDGYKFRYDFRTKEIVQYHKGKEVARQPLTVSGWVDGPEYWCEVMLSQEDLGEELVDKPKVSMRNFEKDFKKSRVSFPKKVEDWYYNGGLLHDAACNLIKNGRDFVSEGTPDRNFLEGFKKDSKKLYDYYYKSVRPRVENFIELYRDVYDDEEYGSDIMKDPLIVEFKEDVDLIKFCAEMDIDRVDLKKLKTLM